MESVCFLFNCKYNTSGVCEVKLGEVGSILASDDILRTMMKHRKKPNKVCFELNVTEAEYELEE